MRKDGVKHVALVLPTRSKKAPSIFSQSAIAEGDDILANAMNLSGIRTMLDDAENEFGEIDSSRHSAFRSLNASSNVDLASLDQLSISRIHLPPGEVSSIEIRNGLSSLNAEPTTMPSLLETHDHEEVGHGRGVTYPPPTSTTQHQVSPHTRQSGHLTAPGKLSKLVNRQGGAPLKCGDKHPQSIRHVSVAQHVIYPHTRQTRQHMPPSPETDTPTHQTGEVATCRVSVNEALPTTVTDKRQVVLSDASAWLPSKLFLVEPGEEKKTR